MTWVFLRILWVCITTSTTTTTSTATNHNNDNNYYYYYQVCTLGTVHNHHEYYHQCYETVTPLHLLHCETSHSSVTAQLIGVACTYPVVSSLVFVIDPVEAFYSTILDAVFSNPFICITPTLYEDPWHHPHLLQVNLDPLMLVVELGEPSAPTSITSDVSLLHCIHYRTRRTRLSWHTQSLGC